MRQESWVVGVDEAGRGPLAGPVVVGAVCGTKEFFSDLSLDRDSKKLSAKKRQEWFEFIKKAVEAGQLHFSFSSVSPSVLDKRGLTNSMRLAVDGVLAQLPLEPDCDQILLDGNLFAPAKYQKQETVVRGDEKIKAISLASIVAKVMRDEMMCDLDQTYPNYGFARHKGYATEEHYLALLRHGRCPAHRLSYTRFLD